MKTIYTKPLRMPDNMPTRISDVLTLTEDDGKVTKIERTVGGKTEEINAGGDNSYTIKGEFTHELDSILFPEGEEQSEIGSDDVIGIFKVTDKKYIDLCAEIINTESPYYQIAIACLADGAKIPGIKKLANDLMKNMLPDIDSEEVRTAKEILNDCLSCISDDAKLVCNIPMTNERDEAFIALLRSKNFIVTFSKPVALQCTLGPNATTSKIFEKYLEDEQKFGMFFEVYGVFTSMFLCGISFSDTESGDNYMLVYANGNSRKMSKLNN